MLFRYVQEWLCEQGISRVELVTINANTTSVAFWRSVGCKPFSERRFLEIDAG